MHRSTSDTHSGEVGLGRQTGWEGFKMNVRHYKKTTVNYNIKVLEQVKLMSISIAFLVFAFS